MDALCTPPTIVASAASLNLSVIIWNDSDSEKTFFKTLKWSRATIILSKLCRDIICHSNRENLNIGHLSPQVSKRHVESERLLTMFVAQQRGLFLFWRCSAWAVRIWGASVYETRRVNDHGWILVELGLSNSIRPVVYITAFVLHFPFTVLFLCKIAAFYCDFNFGLTHCPYKWLHASKFGILSISKNKY